MTHYLPFSKSLNQFKVSNHFHCQLECKFSLMLLCYLRLKTGDFVLGFFDCPSPFILGDPSFQE